MYKFMVPKPAAFHNEAMSIALNAPIKPEPPVGPRAGEGIHKEAVNWYMSIGQIWNGGKVPILNDTLFLSIVDELQDIGGVVEDTWESRVPANPNSTTGRYHRPEC